jgi:hypothetical protein
MMDRGNVRKVEFYSKNKFEKLVHLVGFVIRKDMHNVWHANDDDYMAEWIYEGFSITKVHRYEKLNNNNNNDNKSLQS